MMIWLVITVKADNEVSTFQHLQLFRSRPPPRPPRLTPPTLPCQPPRADQAGADRGEEFWCLEFWSDPWVAQYQTLDNEL